MAGAFRYEYRGVQYAVEQDACRTLRVLQPGPFIQPDGAVLSHVWYQVDECFTSTRQARDWAESYIDTIEFIVSDRDLEPVSDKPDGYESQPGAGRPRKRRSPRSRGPIAIVGVLLLAAAILVRNVR